MTVHTTEKLILPLMLNSFKNVLTGSTPGLKMAATPQMQSNQYHKQARAISHQE